MLPTSDKVCVAVRIYAATRTTPRIMTVGIAAPWARFRASRGSCAQPSIGKRRDSHALAATGSESCWARFRTLAKDVLSAPYEPHQPVEEVRNDNALVMDWPD